jgi:hypothetical protein
MSHGMYANLESLEGTVNSETTLSLTRKSRKIIITNDHPTNSMSFKFNDSETYATLRGTETISLYFTTNKIIIDGTNITYRIWVFG